MPPLSSRQVDTKGKIKLKRKKEGSGNLSTSTQVGIINIHRLLSHEGVTLMQKTSKSTKKTGIGGKDNIHHDGNFSTSIIPYQPSVRW
jgi:hypothetical protein